MWKQQSKYTKRELEKLLAKSAAKLPAKGESFDPLMIDADAFRANCDFLTTFIEEKSTDEEKERLYTTLVEITLVLRIFATRDIFGFFKDEKKSEVARAREARSRTSKKINSIISERLSSLYLRKPNRRSTAGGAASEIIELVNSDLERCQIEPLGISAISKRIKQISRTSGQ